MDVKDAIRKRRSVRSYQEKPVSEEDLNEILEAVRMAPSASNRQAWKFIVVKDDNLRKQLVSVANNQSFVGEAPVVIAAVALEPERIMSCKVPAYAVDLAIAVDHITLAAAEKGLGTCWIGAFSQEKAKELLKIPEQYKVVTLMPLGYPADSARPKSRKTLAEIICIDRFEE